MPPDDPYLTLRSCAEALAADPGDPHLWFELASAQEAIGAILDALSSYQRALGFFVQEGAQLDAARACNKILNIDPNHQLALEQLSQLSAQGALRVFGSTAVGREVSVTEVEASLDPGPVRRTPTPSTSAISVHDADIVEERSVSQAQLPAARLTKARAGGKEVFGQRQAIQTMHGQGPGASLPASKRHPSPSEGTNATPRQPAARATPRQTSARKPAPPAQPPGWLPRALLEAGTLRRLERHELLCREEDDADSLVLLERGRLELAKRGPTNRRITLERLEPGAVLGELALLGDGKWHVTARALEPATVRLLPRRDVLTLVARNAAATQALRRLYRDRLQRALLKTSRLLRGLPSSEALTFLRRCKPLAVKGGQVVVQQGAPATGFYLVLLGELTVTMLPKKGGDPLLLAVLRDGDFFGEIALIYNQPATATLRANGFAQLLHLPAGEFHRFADASGSFLPALEEEARRRERDNRAIMRGSAYFDLQRGLVKHRERSGPDQGD